jgi:hypothetical protein
VNNRFGGLDGTLGSPRKFEARFDAGNGAAALWVNAQAFPADREEWLGNGGRYLRFAALPSVQDG